MCRYLISVNYGRTLTAMIEAGKYDRVYSKNMEGMFQIQRPKYNVLLDSCGMPVLRNDDTEITIVDMCMKARTREVLSRMDTQDLRPTRIEELLALGEKYPDLQREFLLVALGSGWVYSEKDGFRMVPCLYGDRTMRGLRLHQDYSGVVWQEYSRFPAISKKVP